MNLSWQKNVSTPTPTQTKFDVCWPPDLLSLIVTMSVVLSCAQPRPVPPVSADWGSSVCHTHNTRIVTSLCSLHFSRNQKHWSDPWGICLHASLEMGHLKWRKTHPSPSWSSWHCEYRSSQFGIWNIFSRLMLVGLFVIFSSVIIYGIIKSCRSGSCNKPVESGGWQNITKQTVLCDYQDQTHFTRSICL